MLYGTYQTRRAAGPGRGTTVRTPHACQPRACRTYRVPWVALQVPTGGGGIGQGGLPFDVYWLKKAKTEIAVVSE